MRFGNTRMWRPVCAALILLTLLWAPSAANAAFTSTQQASQAVSTETILPPATASVSMTCDNRFLWWARSKITVTSYASATARANYYDIRIFKPSGDLAATAEITKVSASPYTYTSGIEVIGTWKYEIRAYYKVPGSTNIWSSQALTGTLNCT